MKNLSLCILLLAALILLFIPCLALAQDGGDDPCCQGGDPRILSTVQTGALDSPMVIHENISQKALMNARIAVPFSVPTPAGIHEMAWAVMSRNPEPPLIRRRF